MGSAFAVHDIHGVPGLEDFRQLAWQGASVDLRYRFLNRDSAPFGLTFASRESSQPYRRYQCGGGPGFRYGIHARLRPRIDSKLCARGSQPDLSAGMDAFFRNRSRGARIHHRCRAPGDGANASGHLVRLRGALSAEIMRASVWRSCSGHCLFQLSERSRLTASWSGQAWGRPAGSNAALDLVNFERHQARLVFGDNF